MGSLRIPVSQMVAMTPNTRADNSTNFAFGNTTDAVASAGVPRVAWPLSGSVGQYGTQYPAMNFLQLLRINPNATCGLHLFKGAVPTATAFDDGTTAGDSVQNGTAYAMSYRSADRLVSLPLITNSAYVNSAATLVVSLTGGNAIASGTATWFMLTAAQQRLDQYGYTICRRDCIMGTISAPAGGGDLEIETTTITSGQLIRVASISIPLPLNFSV